MSSVFSSLGKLVRIRTGKLDANANDSDGLFPFFTCAKEPLRISTYSYDCECVLIAGNGDLNVKYYNGKFDAYQRTYIIESLSSDVLDVRYLYHFMDTYLDELRHMSIGGVIKYIKIGNLTEAELPLPPLSEQRRIAAILDQADALRTKRREGLAQLDSLTQSIFIEMFGDPVANPMMWPVKKFGDVGTLDRGVSKHRPRNAPELLDGDHPLVQTGEVSNCDGYIRTYTKTYSDIGLKQSKMWPQGTLCITIAANIAKTGILTFDACFPDSVVGFRADEQAIVEYVRVWLTFLQKALEDAAPQAAQKNINLAILRDLNIPSPPLKLQQTFATRIQSVETLKVAHNAALNELDSLFASIQHSAFQGKL